MLWKKKIFSLVILLSAQISVKAMVVSYEYNFEEANRLYNEGKFSQAITFYEMIDLRTPHLFFNLGNAYFRDGQLGKAILNYERSRRLSPRDPDVLANLKFAETQAGVDEINRIPSAGKRLIHSIVWSYTETEWCWYELIALWVTVIGIGFFIWLPKARTTLFIISLASFLCLMGASLALGMQVLMDRTAPQAVIVNSNVQARFAPIDNATVHYQLVEGAIVRVREDRGHWLYIERADGKQGWISSDNIKFITQYRSEPSFRS